MGQIFVRFFRKGEAKMLHGILPLYKPKGFTSHDCVMKARKLLKIKKIGHTGTLDPNVEGVLPICIGEATKIIPFLLSLQKVYIADVSLGKSTTTEDSDGEVVEEKPVIRPPSDNEVYHALEQFKGEIKQTPPIYSAVKVKGKRLYEYARQGIDIERPERHVTIYDIEKLALSEQKENTIFRIKVTCSKGTYIRTLCVDIGKKLGFPSYMSYLQRIESDTITLQETFTFAEIETKLNEGKIDELILPIERGVKHLPSFEVDAKIRTKILQGQKLPISEKVPTTSPFKVMYNNKLLAIYEKHQNNEHEIKPVRVFNVHKNVGE